MSDATISSQEFAALSDHDDALRPWRYKGGSLAAEFRATDFPAAGAFVSTVADAAEQAQHHPDIAVRYPGVVTITVTTHDAGNTVTDRDVDLATTITGLAASAGNVQPAVVPTDHPAPPVSPGPCEAANPGAAADGRNARDVLQPRLATPDDAAAIGQLLDAFNTEYDVPTPGAAVLGRRLEELLAGSSMFAIVAGDPIVAVGLVSVRPCVWYDGRVALLDELYVVPSERNRGIGTVILAQLLAYAASAGFGEIEINVDEGDTDAQRFYERNGYTAHDPDTGERYLRYYRIIER